MKCQDVTTPPVTSAADLLAETAAASSAASAPTRGALHTEASVQSLRGSRAGLSSFPGREPRFRCKHCSKRPWNGGPELLCDPCEDFMHDQRHDLDRGDLDVADEDEL